MYLTTTRNYPVQFVTISTVFIKRTVKATAKFFCTIGAKLVEVQQKRADYWILNNMSDAQLKDIGMTRGEIKQRFHGLDSKT